MEIWKDVIGYEGLYQVSNLGRVKSLNYNKTGREQVLKLVANKKGYFNVVLCKDGKPKRFLVHRLVAVAFIPNPENLPQINHKDEDKTNNCVWNLEWCNNIYNANYGTRNERVADANSKKVLQLDKTTGEVIREWPSTIEVERQLGYANTHISDCCNGKGYKSAYGYKWKYA